MKKKWMAMAIASVMLAVTACGGSGSSDETTAAAQESAGAAEAGGEEAGEETTAEAAAEGETVLDKDTMTIGCYGAIQSLFPANDTKVPGAQVFVNVYDTLLTLDKDGNLQPMLAESWEQVDDTTYRFKLREGVKFHNGEELKASDVVFSMQILCESASTASNTAQFDPSGFVAEDDYTVVLTTTQPFAPFLRSLCSPSMSIINQKFYEEHEAAGDIDLVECGTGPYKVVEWNEGENLLLERFDDYYGGPAKTQYINMRYIPEANTRLMELESGGIDLMQEVPGVSIPDIEANEDLTLWTATGVNTSYLALNFDKISDTTLREAIAHSINNKQLCEICLMGAAEPLDRIVPPTVPGSYDAGAYEYDPELSKQLLAEAGYPDGITLELSYYSSSDNRRMGEFLQGMMAESGITLELNEMDSSAYTPFLNTRQQEAAICTTVCSLRDPYQTLKNLYSESCGEGGNRVNYNNPEFDEMLNAAIAESDETKRNEMYAEIQQYLHDNVVYIPLYNMTVQTATRANIRGFEMIYPTSYQRYNNCYFVEE